MGVARALTAGVLGAVFTVACRALDRPSRVAAIVGGCALVGVAMAVDVAAWCRR